MIPATCIMYIEKSAHYLISPFKKDAMHDVARELGNVHRVPPGLTEDTVFNQDILELFLVGCLFAATPLYDAN